MERVQLRRSAIPGAIPVSLLPGELAINTADYAIYVGDPNGEPIKLAPPTTQALLAAVGANFLANPAVDSLDMGGHQINGLGGGAAAGDAVRFDQVITGTPGLWDAQERRMTNLLAATQAGDAPRLDQVITKDPAGVWDALSERLTGLAAATGPSDALRMDQTITEVSGMWNANSLRLTNLAPGETSFDAATIGQLSDAVIGSYAPASGFITIPFADPSPLYEIQIRSITLVSNAALAVQYSSDGGTTWIAPTNGYTYMLASGSTGSATMGVTNGGQTYGPISQTILTPNAVGGSIVVDLVNKQCYGDINTKYSIDKFSIYAPATGVNAMRIYPLSGSFSGGVVRLVTR